MRRIATLVVCTLAVTLCAAAAFAGTTSKTTTTYPDTLKVDYFINANTSGDSVAVVQLTNSGYTGGNICADVFVFDPQEEMQECCSCLLSPNDLRTLSVNVDLTANTLTHDTLTTGDIRIVAASTNGSGACPLPTTDISPVSYALRAWATHIQTGNQITEAASQDATLSSSELGALQNGCYAINLVGSGSGTCTCGTGD
jgi:hypothetical protein